MRNAIHRRQLAVVKPFASIAQLPDFVRAQLARPRKKNMPRIVALYDGGTIGMHHDEAGNLVPTNDAKELLKPLLIKGLDKEVDVIWFPVYAAIDSTNRRWTHWVSMANAIRLLYNHVDGFLACGGTDTKAHLMAALRFIFPNIGKPIIGCASQLSSSELGDDATRNLYFAFLAASSNLSGVHLAFNEDLREGLHVHKIKDRGFNAFDSPVRHIIGGYDGQLHLYSNAPPRNDQIVTSDLLDFRPMFRDGIVVPKLSPGMTARSLLHMAKDPDCYALLLITFGAGNVRNVEGYPGEMTVIDAMTELHGKSFPVVLGSPMMDGVVDSPYAAGGKAVSRKVGGISGGDTCGATLEVKMMRCLALAWNAKKDELDYDKFRREMFTDQVGELSIKLRK